MTTQVPILERQALVALYEGTSGDTWHNHENWLSAEDVAQWHGVTFEAGHVTQLKLGGNNLSGTLSPLLRHLKHLTHLDLSQNQLRGLIPPQIGNLGHLTFLDLSDNQLRGEIPPRLGILVQLQYLDLHNNQLSGNLPPGLGDLPQLTYLNLSQNQFSGAVPTAWGQLANLTKLNLSETQLTGPLPATLTNLMALESFSFQATGLQELNAEAFQAWLHALPHVQSTGVIDYSVKQTNHALLAALVGVGMVGGTSALVWLLLLPLLGLAPAVALTLLGLAGTGLVVRKLYALPGGPPQRALPSTSAVSTTKKQLERSLHALVSATRDEVPQDIFAKVEHIEEIILAVLPHIENINSSERDIYVIRQTVLEYLPEALENYRILPPEYANTKIIREGKTAHQLLIEQLDILESEISTIAARFPLEDAQRLLIHGRFLEDKFKKPDSWLEP